MTIVRATAWQKKNASLFNVVHYRIPSLLRERVRVRVKDYNQFSAPINNAVERVKIML